MHFKPQNHLSKRNSLHIFVKLTKSPKTTMNNILLVYNFTQINEENNYIHPNNIFS